jgi:capsular polysaccharide biosynthesis protein
MAETVKSAQNDNDEIDLIQVLERISRFLSTYKWELITAVIAGIVCGWVIFLVKPRLYGSTLILHSQVLSNSEEIKILDSWNTLRKNGEYAVLSRNLNCPESLIKSIQGLEAADIQITQPTSGFTVDVLVSDTAILESLQKAIIYGLENNEYVSEKVKLRRDNTIKLLESIKREIDKLDSTKKKIESSNSEKRPGSSSFIVDISDVNVQMINLNEKLYQYQEVLKFVDAIQVLQNFEKYAKPTSPRLSIMLASGFLGGLFIGSVWAMFKNLKLKFATIRKNRQNHFSDKEMA